MRKRLMGLLAGAVIAAAMIPGMASAHGPGGFHHGFGHRGFGLGFGLGFGYPGYYGYGGYPYYYPYTYEDLGGCYVARKRVRTARGWRFRNVEVCE
ncbi:MULTISPECIES: hypothetical protein [unclassified Bradyrhizobium]|uniref:hypothetical protein n=1 Tax=unclassified Bradyrhizobium TaxID=2631580 RepID=UPI0028EB855D|nr:MULTISPECIES: hypothetical protein [unclassified Bradyrhizobium]